MSEKKTTETATEAAQNRFDILKIYIKDISYESPLTPALFTEQAEWKPETNLQINAESHPLKNDLYEVVLNITVKQTQDDTDIMLVEVKQAGLFRLEGFEEQQLGHMLGSYCPNLLFPFAREVVADLVSKGGLPQLLLAPINFDALYARHLEKLKTSVAGTETAQ